MSVDMESGVEARHAKPQISPVEFRGKKSPPPLAGSCGGVVRGTASEVSCAGVAPRLSLSALMFASVEAA